MRKTVAFVGILIATAVMILGEGVVVSGCRGTKPSPEAKTQDYVHKMREAVSLNVKEKDRRDRMLARVGQMEAVERNLNCDIAGFVETYRGMNGDYEVPRAAFDDLFGEFDARIQKARDRFFDLHFQLTALSTEEEWDRIVKYEVEAYEEITKPRVRKEAAK
jgi:hypothetical protein